MRRVLRAVLAGLSIMAAALAILGMILLISLIGGGG